MLNKIATTALLTALSLGTVSIGVANADSMSDPRMQRHMMMSHHHMSMMEHHHMMMRKRMMMHHMMMKKHMMHPTM